MGRARLDGSQRPAAILSPRNLASPQLQPSTTGYNGIECDGRPALGLSIAIKRSCLSTGELALLLNITPNRIFPSPKWQTNEPTLAHRRLPLTRSSTGTTSTTSSSLAALPLPQARPYSSIVCTKLESNALPYTC